MPLGRSSSGVDVLSCSVLACDLRFSFGGGTGRGWEDIEERTESFSTGGGGRMESGDSTFDDSGSFGSSGITIFAGQMN